MTDLQDKQARPTLEEIGAYVRNPVFARFCREIQETHRCAEKIEYSACSLAPGWNVKFKKAGKPLCTIYPHEQYFTAMVVVGRKEKAGDLYENSLLTPADMSAIIHHVLRA